MVNIAESDNIMVTESVDIVSALATATDTGDIQSLAGWKSARFLNKNLRTSAATG